ncbi:hypothetical protein SIL87_15545 [Acidiphilium acidophilum]|uniref:Uncharacterized protein n=1 Tax=Acidiphilium acidophilum TaxID=76588 RepID=A0AAW9DT37_ACIAO|nr:hypothetical protein [Acidiphilium acidophilum]
MFRGWGGKFAIGGGLAAGSLWLGAIVGRLRVAVVFARALAVAGGR